MAFGIHMRSSDKEEDKPFVLIKKGQVCVYVGGEVEHLPEK